MRIKELIEDNNFLAEAPLPSDWDSAIFDDRVPFKTRVEYAKARAEQVGKGSSRVAFIIPYQGRKTILKVALNKNKGLAQNQEEADLLDDYYIRGLGNVIPIIDYDERNSRPTWIHTEYATKISQKQLEKYFGGYSMYEVVGALEIAKKGGRTDRYAKMLSDLEDNENFTDFQDLILNYTQIGAQDLTRKANWGLYKGRPVIIDLGFTDNTKHLYGF